MGYFAEVKFQIKLYCLGKGKKDNELNSDCDLYIAYLLNDMPDDGLAYTHVSIAVVDT